VAIRRILILMMAISFCCTVSKALGQDRSADRKEIWKLENAYWEYIKKGELSKFNGLFHSEVIIWPQGVPNPTGRGGEDRMIFGQPGFKILTYSLNPQATNMFENVAIVYYGYSFITPDKLLHAGRMAHVWINQEGKWRIIGEFAGSANLRE
jgi:hypothetical protein